MNDIEDQYDIPRVWCRECAQPVTCHLQDCPALNNLEDNNE